jgi:hypothetical protein
LAWASGASGALKSCADLGFAGWDAGPLRVMLHCVNAQDSGKGSAWRAEACADARRYGLHVQHDITLIKAVARAFRWRRMLEAGRYGTIDEIAAVEKTDDSCVSRVLRLKLSVPGILEAILDGRQPEGTTLPGLLKGVPVEWKKQF